MNSAPELELDYKILQFQNVTLSKELNEAKMKIGQQQKIIDELQTQVFVLTKKQSKLKDIIENIGHSMPQFTSFMSSLLQGINGAVNILKSDREGERVPQQQAVAPQFVNGHELQNPTITLRRFNEPLPNPPTNTASEVSENQSSEENNSNSENQAPEEQNQPNRELHTIVEESSANLTENRTQLSSSRPNSLGSIQEGVSWRLTPSTTQFSSTPINTSARRKASKSLVIRDEKLAYINVRPRKLNRITDNQLEQIPSVILDRLPDSVLEDTRQVTKGKSILKPSNSTSSFNNSNPNNSKTSTSMSKENSSDQSRMQKKKKTKKQEDTNARSPSRRPLRAARPKELKEPSNRKNSKSVKTISFRLPEIELTDSSPLLCVQPSDTEVLTEIMSNVISPVRKRGRPKKVKKIVAEVVEPENNDDIKEPKKIQNGKKTLAPVQETVASGVRRRGRPRKLVL